MKNRKAVYDMWNLSNDGTEDNRYTLIKHSLMRFWEANRYKMCDEWRTCSAFIDWCKGKINGEVGECYTIERERYSEPFSENNIKWRSRYGMRIVRYDGYDYGINKIAEHFKTNRKRLEELLDQGYSIEECENMVHSHDKSTYKKSVTIRMYANVWDLISEQAIKERTTFSAIANRILEEWVNKEKASDPTK